MIHQKQNWQGFSNLILQNEEEEKEEEEEEVSSII